MLWRACWRMLGSGERITSRSASFCTLNISFVLLIDINPIARALPCPTAEVPRVSRGEAGGPCAADPTERARAAGFRF